MKQPIVIAQGHIMPISLNIPHPVPVAVSIYTSMIAIHSYIREIHISSLGIPNRNPDLAGLHRTVG
jgi:hypothetical protein